MTPNPDCPPSTAWRASARGGSSLYRRVLVRASVDGTCELAWVYTVETTGIKRRRIVSGCWPAQRPPPSITEERAFLARFIPFMAHELILIYSSYLS